MGRRALHQTSAGPGEATADSDRGPGRAAVRYKPIQEMSNNPGDAGQRARPIWARSVWATTLRKHRAHTTADGNAREAPSIQQFSF